MYGHAIPDGDCWYVARADAESRVELWDPRTGVAYVFAQSAAGGGPLGANAGTGKRTFDPLCPLKKIWAVVGEKNVWANIQPAEAPALMRFVFTEKKCWQPFLDEQGRAPNVGEKVLDRRTWQVSELEYAAPAGPEKVRSLE